MKKLLTILSILLIATASYAQTYTSQFIIDGDILTVITSEGKTEIVQLIGIDAPEAQPNAEAVEDSKRTGQDLKTIVVMGQKAAEFVRGLLKKGDEVISILHGDRKGQVFTICQGGYGKRTPLSDYRITGRNGKGIINIKTNNLGTFCRHNHSHGTTKTITGPGHECHFSSNIKYFLF